MKKVFFSIFFLISTIFVIKAQDKSEKSTQPVTNNSEITFDKLLHDYGSVNIGANGNCEFIFTNTGTEPLILSNVQTS